MKIEREFLIRVDSFLSALWHRHLNRNDFENQQEYNEIITELRRLVKEDKHDPAIEMGEVN